MKCKYYGDALDGFMKICSCSGNLPESSPGWRDVREELLKWIDGNTVEVNNARGRYINHRFSAVSSGRLKNKINELLPAPPGADKG